jgi:hypothetical protein
MAQNQAGFSPCALFFDSARFAELLIDFRLTTPRP